MEDIYFTPAWGELNTYIEEGWPQIFECDTIYGKIRNMFIVRKIPVLIKDEQYYDISSPYGYGGPYIENCKSGYKQKLLQEYETQFGEYCKRNRIVSEFVRFHPIVDNGIDFKAIYNAECIRHTVGTSLEKDDPVQEEFSKSCRKNIRRALNAGVQWRVTENPGDISSFIKVYYSTMDRNEAGKFYYFKEEYFQKCLELFGENIILVEAVYEENVIAAGFYICSGSVIHAHLSGTLREYIHLSPAYVIKYATAVWGKEHGYKLVHYGGGTTNNPDDSLYQFKLKFTKQVLFDFYVGRKIWNKEVYDYLVEQTKSQDTEYFPKYRG